VNQVNYVNQVNRKNLITGRGPAPKAAQARIPVT